MTELSIDRPSSRENGNGWRSTIMMGLFAAFMAVVGWIATNAQTARVKMTEAIASSQSRIAVLEESNRNMRESQARIEIVLDDIRRQLQERRR